MSCNVDSPCDFEHVHLLPTTFWECNSTVLSKNQRSGFKLSVRTILILTSVIGQGSSFEVSVSEGAPMQSLYYAITTVLYHRQFTLGAGTMQQATVVGTIVIASCSRLLLYRFQEIH